MNNGSGRNIDPCGTLQVTNCGWEFSCETYRKSPSNKEIPDPMKRRACHPKIPEFLSQSLTGKSVGGLVEVDKHDIPVMRIGLGGSLTYMSQKQVGDI